MARHFKYHFSQILILSIILLKGVFAFSDSLTDPNLENFISNLKEIHGREKTMALYDDGLGTAESQKAIIIDPIAGVKIASAQNVNIPVAPQTVPNDVKTQMDMAMNPAKYLLALGKDFFSHVSVFGGINHYSHVDDGIWYDANQPSHHFDMNTPSWDVRFTLRANSIGLLSAIQNSLAKAVVDRTSFVVGYADYGKASIQGLADDSDAQYASCRNNRAACRLLSDWVGHGRASGVYVAFKADVTKKASVTFGEWYYKPQWVEFVHPDRGLSTSPAFTWTGHSDGSTKTGFYASFDYEIFSHINLELNTADDTSTGESLKIPAGYHEMTLALGIRGKFGKSQ